MAEMPQSWGAYRRLQQKLSTTTGVELAATLEVALNIILGPNYSVEATTEADFLRVAESAARRERHRALLRRRYHGDLPACEPTPEPDYEDHVWLGGFAPHGQSLDDNVHARRELGQLASQLAEADFALLIGVATGMTYEELARRLHVSPAALRTRVARLRRAFAAQTHGVMRQRLNLIRSGSQRRKSADLAR